MDNVIFKDRYIKVGDVNTRYWSAGEKGSTVILLHGVGCSVEFGKKISQLFQKGIASLQLT